MSTRSIDIAFDSPKRLTGFIVLEVRTFRRSETEVCPGASEYRELRAHQEEPVLYYTSVSLDLGYCPKSLCWEPGSSAYLMTGPSHLSECLLQVQSDSK